jgi:hypothetical protein
MIMFHRLLRHALAAVSLTTLLIGGSASAAAKKTLADFEGRTIDLSQSWEGARACNVTSAGTTCYRSEQQMNDAIASTQNSRALPLASCSPALRLYDGTSFTGTVLNVSTTGSLVVLSSVGFDNLTSSYKVGACTADLYSSIGTGLYPGNTAANAQASSMLSGWNNTISSVVIP